MAEKQPQVSSTVSGTSELAMTSASLGIRWHFARSWASLLTLRAEANNAGTQPAVTAATSTRLLLLQCHRDASPAKSLRASPRKGALPKTGKSRGLLLVSRERETLQEQWVSAHSLVGRTSCSAPGSCAIFCSVWISKLFDYASVSGAKGKNFSILGSLFSNGHDWFFRFFTHSAAASESWSQTQLWPYALC